jgi:hypothetical protein
MSPHPYHYHHAYNHIIYNRTAFLVGFPFVSIIVNIPQRAQAVSGLSPLNAGLTLLPLMLTSPVATVLSGYLTAQLKVPSFYVILAAAILQVIGVGLTCSLPSTPTEVSKSQYGFEVIMGAGFGLGLTTLITFSRAVVSDQHLGKLFLRWKKQSWPLIHH